MSWKKRKSVLTSARGGGNWVDRKRMGKRLYPVSFPHTENTFSFWDLRDTELD